MLLDLQIEHKEIVFSKQDFSKTILDERVDDIFLNQKSHSVQVFSKFIPFGFFYSERIDK